MKRWPLHGRERRAVRVQFSLQFPCPLILSLSLFTLFPFLFLALAFFKHPVIMSLYPSLEDMNVDQMARVRQ
jgi:hypothetical protein